MDSGLLAFARPRNDELRLSPCPTFSAFWKPRFMSMRSSAPVRSTNRCSVSTASIAMRGCAPMTSAAAASCFCFCARLACALTSARRHSAAARRSWPDSYGIFHRRRRACRLGSAPRRGRRRDREPSQMATRRRKHLFPRSRRARARVGDPGIVAGVLVGRRIPDKAQRVSDAPQIRDRQNLKRVSRSRVCSAPLSCCAAPGKRWKTTTAHTPERFHHG